jgi:hypothetical protein
MLNPDVDTNRRFRRRARRQWRWLRSAKSLPAYSATLPKFNAFAGPIFVDEINSGGFKSTSDRCLIGGHNWNLSIHHLNPSDCRDSHFGRRR